MFRRLGIAASIYAVSAVLRQAAVINSAFLAKTGLLFFIYHIQDVIYLVYTLMWVVFVDAALYHSRDGIRRRYRITYIPYIFLVILILIAFLLNRNYAASADAFTENRIRLAGIIETLFYLTAFVIGAFCMIYAFRLARCYQKEVKQPVFLRLDVFIIPWLVGFLCGTVSVLTSILYSFQQLGFIIRLPDISAICVAASLILTYISMKNRYIYMEYETGFFKGEYMDDITEFMTRRHAVINCGIILKFSKGSEEISKLLSKLKPDRSSVITFGDGKFLMISDVYRSSAIQLFLKTIRSEAACAIPGTVVDPVVLLRYRDEKDGAFLDRLLEAYRNAGQ